MLSAIPIFPHLFTFLTHSDGKSLTSVCRRFHKFVHLVPERLEWTTLLELLHQDAGSEYVPTGLVLPRLVPPAGCVEVTTEVQEAMQHKEEAEQEEKRSLPNERKRHSRAKAKAHRKKIPEIHTLPRLEVRLGIGKVIEWGRFWTPRHIILVFFADWSLHCHLPCLDDEDFPDKFNEVDISSVAVDRDVFDLTCFTKSNSRQRFQELLGLLWPEIIECCLNFHRVDSQTRGLLKSI
jgi:hypothetical protein